MTSKSLQDTASSTVDTLTQSYGDRWDGAGAEESSAFIQFMSSHELIYVVLGVSLIIWFVLLFFMIRVDRNVANLEEKMDERNPSALGEEQSEKEIQA